MGLVITRPILADGNQSTGTPWSTPSYVIDGKLISENFQVLGSAINGGLHGCNLALSPRSVPDSKIRFREFENTTGYGVAAGSRAVGMQHSHDGIDSRHLGSGAITMFATRYNSYGSWMCPANSGTFIVYHGSVKLESPPPQGIVFQILVCEIPYDKDDAYGRNADDTAWTDYPEDSHRVQLNARFTDTTYMDRLQYLSGEIIGGTEAYDGYPYIAITVVWKEAFSEEDVLSGVYIDWIYTLIANRNWAGLA